MLLETAPSDSSKYPQPIEQNYFPTFCYITHVTAYLKGFSNFKSP